MNKKVIVETKELKQYFPLNNKRNEKEKLVKLKQKIQETYLKERKKLLKFSDIKKAYDFDPEGPSVPDNCKPLFEKYDMYKDLHGQKLSVMANDGISLQIHEGETVGIVGESGCGKSTFGRSLLKLYKPTDGQVFYCDQEITSYGMKKMRPLRTDMQIIFQDPYSSLDPRMTVGQIIGEALVEHKLYKKGSKEIEKYILKTMKICGLDDYMIHRYPHEFSGGQRQRIGIARALALEPKFIVCDEAVSALDVSIQSQIINLLKDLQNRFGIAYLFISHDLSVVKHISDRIGVMYLGKMVELADKHDLYNNPQHPYTQALLSAIPLTDLEIVKKRKRFLLEGDLPSNVIPPTGCKFHTRCPIAQDICSRKVPEYVADENGHFCACHYRGKSIYDR